MSAPIADDDAPTAHELAQAARLLPTLDALNAAMLRLRALPPCSNCNATGYGETTELCRVCGGTGRER